MDELVKMGTEAKSKSGGKVTNVLIQQVGKTGNAYYSYPYLSAFDGGIFATKANGDYDPNKVIVNSAGSIKGAEVLADLGKKKVLSTNVGDDNAEGLFTSGKAPFFITGPWSVPNAKKAGIKYEITSLPVAGRRRRRCSRSSASRCSTSPPRPRTPSSPRSSSPTTSRARTSSSRSSRRAAVPRP